MNADADRIPASDEVGEATVRPGLGGRDRTTLLDLRGLLWRATQMVNEVLGPEQIVFPEPPQPHYQACPWEQGCEQSCTECGNCVKDFMHEASCVIGNWEVEEELRKSAAVATPTSSTSQPRTPAPARDSLSATESAATSASQEVNP